jgi:hypothetical protein
MIVERCFEGGCRGGAHLTRNPGRKASTDVGDLPASLIRFRNRCFFVDASKGKSFHKPEASKNEDSL